MNANDVNLLRAVRWPVTLITLGALFALNNFTNYGFHQTWPVLLIVFGLMRACWDAPRGSRRQMNPPSGTNPGAGGAR